MKNYYKSNAELKPNLKNVAPDTVITQICIGWSVWVRWELEA